MKTLYDLIGALADDDADELRAAFRRAVKANHPDVNPDDPEAAKAFRQIVRANAILSDERQRQAYDRLLEVARQQQRRKLKRSVFSVGLRKLGRDAMVSAVASMVFIAGYFLLKPVDRVPVASAQVAEVPRHDAAQIAAARPTELSSRERADPGYDLDPVVTDVKIDANVHDVKEPTGQDDISHAVTMDAAPASDVSPVRESGPKDVKYYRERAIAAYRSGDLSIALVNFDLAIQKDPACSDCYVERGIVLNRMGDRKGAFSDVAEARRIDALNRSRVPSGAGAH